MLPSRASSMGRAVESGLPGAKRLVCEHLTLGREWHYNALPKDGAFQNIFYENHSQKLRALYEDDNRSGLPPNFIGRLRRILFLLQEATHPESAAAPGFRLHPLTGNRSGQWSIRVSGNWRIVFRFENAEVVDVDLTDYH